LSEELKLKRGGQPGNQNARKHGFYTAVLDKDQKHRLKQAALVKGLDEEISLLRVKIQSVVEQEPGNTRLILQGVVTLARLLRTSNKLGFGKQESIGEAIRNIISDYGIPLGIARSKDNQNKSI
jgi:hypothetical protein